LRAKIEDDYQVAWAFRAQRWLAPLIFHLVVGRFFGHGYVVHMAFA
jgi:hypothetical protein